VRSLLAESAVRIRVCSVHHYVIIVELVESMGLAVFSLCHLAIELIEWSDRRDLVIVKNVFSRSASRRSQSVITRISSHGSFLRRPGCLASTYSVADVRTVDLDVTIDPVKIRSSHPRPVHNVPEKYKPPGEKSFIAIDFIAGSPSGCPRSFASVPEEWRQQSQRNGNLITDTHPSTTSPRVASDE
jgi:hypothetical protein